MLVVTGDSDAAVKLNTFPEANPAPLTETSKFAGVVALIECPIPSVPLIANPGKLLGARPLAARSGDDARIVVTASETTLALAAVELRSSVR
jgi:hypothetical protein